MTRPKQTPSRGKTRVSPPKKRGAKAKLLLSAAFLLLMALLIAVMALSARVVHVRHTDVYLQDLPAGFDGITILYVSDIDLLSESTFRATRRLFQRMQALKPDVLLLGGDYTSETLLSILNRQGDVSAENSNREIALRNEFFRALETFSAPMGKYAVRAQADPSVDVLEAAMADSQITLLQDEAIPLYSGAERIYLVGLAPFAEDSAALSGMSGQFSAGDCVVVAAHSAGSFSAIQIAEASDGGTWADLVRTQPWRPDSLWRQDAGAADQSGTAIPGGMVCGKRRKAAGEPGIGLRRRCAAAWQRAGSPSIDPAKRRTAPFRRKCFT